jgi:hypothetical protein
MGRPAKDLTGQHFGNLIVLERSGSSSDGHALWKCECQCEDKTIVYKTSNVLKRGTPSCGCLTSKLISEKAKQKYKDLTNQRFGLLVAKEIVGSTGQSKIWRCECDCGNKNFTTTSRHLISGNTKSCGCLVSIGESNIQNILIQNQIPFIREKSFNDFKYSSSNGNPRFDFYLTEINRLVEFDGRQHYEKVNLNWEDNVPLTERQKRDQEKNQYAQEHNIPLVRIPYWERDNITLDMILGDQYLVKAE